MNPAWTEGTPEFDFSKAKRPVLRPDSVAQPLKSADFVAVYAHETWMIEVKDPEAAPAQHQAGAISSMVKEIQNDILLKDHLLPKIYGTFAYLVLTNTEPRGQLRYGVVIGLTGLSAEERRMLTDKIQRVIDRIGPKIRHGRSWPIVEVHNLASWNDAHPDMSVTRLP